MVGVKRKSNTTVRFSGTSTKTSGGATDRHGILKADDRRQTRNPLNRQFTFGRHTWMLTTVVLLIAIVALTYRGYLDTRAVNYPFQGPKVCASNDSILGEYVLQKNNVVNHPLWGTYRPGMYFGLRTNEPADVGSVSSGIMWYTHDDLLMTGSLDTIRYMCDNSHKNLVYGYVEHDTENYGHQVINDGKYNGFTLQTIFLRPNPDNSDKTLANTDWTTRIVYETNNSANVVSLIWYVYIESDQKYQLSNNKEYSLDILPGENNKLDIPIATVMGLTPSLSDFQMTIIPTASKNAVDFSKFIVDINTSTSSVSCLHAASLKQCISKTMDIKEINNNLQIMLVDENYNKQHYNQYTSMGFKNLVAVQITISHNRKKSKFKHFSYSLDVAYTQNKKQSELENKLIPPLIGKHFDLVHNEYSIKFRQHFQKSFPITINEDTDEKQLLLDFAKATFSNMAGSIGYFYGYSLVRDDSKHFYSDLPKTDVTNAVKYWKAGLLTAVPSRSQFPRGFLWDDGFHGLMLGCWSIELELNILGHWMDLLNHEGWIPREQILGWEAKSRVPKEFIVQSSRAANPPALLLTVELLIKRIKQHRQTKNNNNSSNEKLNFDEIDNMLKRLYPRLKAWYTWFDNTQRAINTYNKYSTSNANECHLDKKFVGYRWRGRDAVTNKELNPKTLTSGMDDYPRSSHPVKDDGTSNLHLDGTLNKDFDMSERHVDLHCWMAHGARILNNLHNYLYASDVASFDNKFTSHFWMLVESLDRLHWTEGNDETKNSTFETPMYADYGIHTDDVKLIQIQGTQDYIRIVGHNDPPRWRFVNSHIGYNALFPMFFQLVKSSQRLNAILDLIEGINFKGSKSHGLLTKSCGLRSLSKSSPLYKVKNTVNDPPYWRGSIWINMQYLACSSLNYYANLPEAAESTYMNNNEYKDLQPIRYLDLKTKQRCRRLYNKIRNDVIQCIYQEWKRTGFVFEQYEDDRVSDSTLRYFHKGKGTRPFTGWSANIVLIMAEIY